MFDHMGVNVELPEWKACGDHGTVHAFHEAALAAYDGAVCHRE